MTFTHALHGTRMEITLVLNNPNVAAEVFAMGLTAGATAGVPIPPGTVEHQRMVRLHCWM